MEAKAFLELIVKSIVVQPECVSVEVQTESESGALFRVRVDSDDLGHVIGRQGRTARSLRILLSVLARKLNASYAIDIVGKPY